MDSPFWSIYGRDKIDGSQFNNVGSLIKLDFRSLLRYKIRFARAFVRVYITEPLLEYAKIMHTSGIACGYLIWYEDFSSGCSFVGWDDHLIDNYTLLYPPQKRGQS